MSYLGGPEAAEAAEAARPSTPFALLRPPRGGARGGCFCLSPREFENVKSTDLGMLPPLFL